MRAYLGGSPWPPLPMTSCPLRRPQPMMPTPISLFGADACSTAWALGFVFFPAGWSSRHRAGKAMPAKATPTVCPSSRRREIFLETVIGCSSRTRSLVVLPRLEFPTGRYACVIAVYTLRMALTMSFTSSSEKLGSMITPPARSRMSIVRGQHCAAVADRLALGALEGRPVGMDGDFLLDPLVGRQDHRAARPRRRDPFRPHRPQELVAPLAGAEVEEDAHAQVALDVRRLAQLESRQVGDALADLARRWRARPCRSSPASAPVP